MLHLDGTLRKDEAGFFATCRGHTISDADAHALFDEQIDVIKAAKSESRRIPGTASATTQALQAHFGPTATPQAGSSVELWVLELGGRLLNDAAFDALTEDDRLRVIWRPFFFWRSGSIVLEGALGDVIRRNAASFDAAIARVAPRHHRDMMAASAPFEIELPAVCADQVLSAIPPAQRSAVVERNGKRNITIHLRLHPEHSVCVGTINHAELTAAQVCRTLASLALPLPPRLSFMGALSPVHRRSLPYRTRASS